MKKTPAKIGSAVSQKRVKLHLFEPSQREIWTVVGMGGEYWLDPELEYCSCPGYYFGRLNGKDGCYHLESLEIARREDSVATVIFSDDEYAGFVSGLISDLQNFYSNLLITRKR